MKAANFKVFDGRSIYSHRRCIRLNLDLEGYEKATTDKIENFANLLISLIPGLSEHRCCSGEKEGFVNKLREGTSLQHVCGHVAIALQNEIGLDVSYCSDSKDCSEDCFAIYEFMYKDTGIAAGNTAAEILNLLIQKKNVEINTMLQNLREILEAEEATSGCQSSTFEEFMKSMPIVTITGTNGKTTTTRLIGYTLAKAGFKVGMTTTDGIYINGRCIFEGDTTGPRSARTVLRSSEINMAVLETARGGIVRDGLAYNLADTAVITNIGDDHLGLDGIDTLEELAKVKALIGEAVKEEGYVVINGDNSMSVSILNRFKSKLIIFSEDKYNKVMRQNITKGGYGIYTEDGNLFIENKSTLKFLMPVEQIGITFNGALDYNIQNAMAACGALISMGVDPAVIRESFRTFKCNEALNPGRFNVFDVNGVRVILDYGHNIDGYKSVLEGLNKMKYKNLVGIIGVPGDRLDRTTLEVGRISGSYFDSIIIKEDKDRRGRLSGEVAEILKTGVLAAGFDSNNIRIILDEREALEKALNSANVGDIVIIFFEEYDPLLQLVKSKISTEEKEAVVV